MWNRELIPEQRVALNTHHGALTDDLMFVGETGRKFRLRAGHGLMISGETPTHYRVEVMRRKKREIGYIRKEAASILVSVIWYNIRAIKLSGWLLSRYVRVF